MTVLDFPAASAPPRPPCWVRVTRERPDGFVEFDFALGSPDLAVELILPRAAFEAFCAEHRTEQQPLTRPAPLQPEETHP